jgi:hypothetical protein
MICFDQIANCAFYEGPTNFCQVVSADSTPEVLDPIDMIKIYKEVPNFLENYNQTVSEQGSLNQTWNYSEDEFENHPEILDSNQEV